MSKIQSFSDSLERLFRIPNNNIINATIQVTDACNLCCTYCYQINKHHHVMDFETGKQFIDILLNKEKGLDRYYTGDIEGLTLEFIGGEPFIAIDLINQLTEYLIDQLIQRQSPLLNRFKISFSSNGTLYFDPRVQEYLKKYFNFISLSISIDGNRELHDACRIFPDGSGSYDIAISAVKHYTQILGGSMGSKMTIASQNVSYVYEAVKNLIELGYKEINLNCVFEEGWTSEHAKILYNQLKQLSDYIIDNDLTEDIYVSMFEQRFFRPMSPEQNNNWCGGTGKMIAVDYKGDIYPCLRYMESSLGDDIKPPIIGNLKDGIMVTDEQKHCVECLKAITRRSQSTDECFYCPIAEGCAWCSAYNYQCFGTADKRATYICIMHKARALGNAYYWNKKFRKEHSNKRMKLWIPKDWALEIIDQDEWNMLKQMEGAE